MTPCQLDRRVGAKTAEDHEEPHFKRRKICRLLQELDGADLQQRPNQRLQEEAAQPALLSDRREVDQEGEELGPPVRNPEEVHL